MLQKIKRKTHMVPEMRRLDLAKESITIKCNTMQVKDKDANRKRRGLLVPS